MRDIIYHVATSMDGYIAHSDGSTDGFLEEGDHVTDYLEGLKAYDTVVMGKNTYTYGYQFGMKPGDLAYPWMEHYIVSKTLNLPTSSPVHVISGQVVRRIKDLKAAEGGPIYLCGGGNLAGLLYESNLIDRIILKQNPIIFGQGISLFSNLQSDSFSWKLDSCKLYDSGVVRISYNRK